ncbi:MAG TPA: 3-hydroxyacyl-CoA dehydrogenase NAD-binding domain-containing protein [Burkholderiaceae bacterium]|nr:3-hydroxyacyl-CoA dehydrogenase NAD-binding domain-containing protein [Burkholderiaceae bacterium]
MSNAVNLELGSDGILVATIDVPGRPMNVVGDQLMTGLRAAVDKLAEQNVKGLILTSGKADFCAGGDLDNISKWTTPQQPFEASMAMKRVLRKMETQGKPVVAAMNGHTLGGGLEIALACHARIAIDDPKLKIGQPEVKLGLLPGGGGTQRLPRLLGIQQGLQICAEGNDIAPAKAKQMGLLADTATDRADLMAKAKAWIAANPKAQQPWDNPKFKWPGGDSRSEGGKQLWAIAPSIANAKSFGNYPAVQHIMSCVFEGGLLDFDAACEVESRYFAACVMSQESKNLINTLWYQLNAIKKGASRPKGPAPSKVKKLGILGAGMMGGGIAYVSARAGMDVVLLDSTQELADKGKGYSQGLLDAAIKKNRSTVEKRDALLAKIKATTSYDDLKGCDLIIEAVFEDRAVKAEVTKKAEAQLERSATFASNTSTLPITGLAKASVRPKNFIGLHFFSPVDKMQLVEIIVGKETSDDTLAKGFDYVLQIGKTPIVVNDSRGFYTSRVFGTYVSEGIAMLKEGVHPRSIEQAGLQAGMPMPPLALQDEVSLSLSMHVRDQTKKDLAAEGKTYNDHPAESVTRQLVEIGRIGKKAGKGFYDWGIGPDGKGKQLWPELTKMYPPKPDQPNQQELIDRLLFAQANEAARCYEENVVRSVADANIGSIFGWGFAPFQGGALQFINAYGPKRFVERGRELAKKYGARFEPAGVVVKMAGEGGKFSS